MDNILWFVIVIVYSIAFVAQLIVNVVNFFRTGKLTKMTFNPPTKEEVKEALEESDGDLEQAKASLIAFHEAQLKKLRGD